MEDLILAVVNKLDVVQELNYKDENWAQLDGFGTAIPVQWPCALVQISGGQFSNFGINYREDSGNLQQGTISIEITIADMKITNTSFKAPTNQRIKGLSIYSLVEKVHKVLQGWKPLANSGAMVRTSFQSVLRDDGVQEKRIIYSIGLNGC